MSEVGESESDKGAQQLDVKSEGETSKDAGDIESQAEFAGQHISLRRIDLISVWLGIMYLLSFFWKNNLASGALPFGTPDFTLGNKDTSGTISVYYIFFVLAVLPSVLVQERFVKARVWISFCVFIVGVVATGYGFIRTTKSIYPVRLFFALSEAGIFPCIVLYLMRWYTRFQTATRVAVTYAVAILVVSASYILAYMLNLAWNDKSHESGWRWIFLFYGLLTAVVGFISYWIIPEYPRAASFLTPAQRDIVIERVAEDRGDHEEQTVFGSIVAVLSNCRFWGFAFVTIALGVPLSNYANYSITVTGNLSTGHHPLSTRQQYSLFLPPYAVAVGICIAVSYYSDKFRRRGIFIAGSSVLAVIGHIFLISTTNPGVQFAGLFFVCPGLNAMYPLLLIWGTESVQGATQRAVTVSFLYLLPQFGAPISQYMFKAADGPAFHMGYGVSLALTIVAGLGALALSCEWKFTHHKSG